MRSPPVFCQPAPQQTVNVRISFRRGRRLSVRSQTWHTSTPIDARLHYAFADQFSANSLSAPAMISACLCLRSHIPAPNLPFLFFPFECPRASPAVLLRCRRADVGPTVPLRLAGVLLQGARARRAQAALRRGSRRGWRRGSQRRSQRGWRRGWRRGCEASSDGGA